MSGARLTALVVTALALLACPAQSLAFPGQRRDESLAQRIMRPACGHAAVVAPVSAVADELGEADPNTCEISVNWSLVKKTYGGGPLGKMIACHVTVHEEGHLAGRQHSSNPRSVMYPYPARIYPPCEKLYRQPHRFYETASFGLLPL